jgi:methyltransferase
MGELDYTHVWAPGGRPLALLAVVVLPWLFFETWRSRRNEAALRAAGAIEPNDDVYAWMRVVYPGMFVAMMLEGVFWQPAILVADLAPAALAAGLAVFFAGKLLKWWAILSLGRLWTFHVLVPYRFMRHPNYFGLLGEILGTALMMPAPVTGVLSAFGFGALLVARIRVEERMLREVAR